MWTYHQRTGTLDAPDGHPVATGYSGHDIGKNDPYLQDRHNQGPIPCGVWHIVALECEHVAGKHGPYVLRLEPAPDTQTFGRDGFLVHGDSTKDPGTASEGCIIQGRAVREQLWKSSDHDILVVAE